jgi:hypothetical protein
MSAVLDWRVLAVEYVADHAQHPPGLVGRFRVGETRQALDGLEVSLVRPWHRVGRDGDVEIWIGVLGVAQPPFTPARKAARVATVSLGIGRSVMGVSDEAIPCLRKLLVVIVHWASLPGDRGVPVVMVPAGWEGMGSRALVAGGGFGGCSSRSGEYLPL